LRLNYSILLFFIPLMLFVSVYYVYPILMTVYMSFFSPNGDFVGLENYIRFLFSRDTINLARFPKPPLGTIMHSIIWILIYLPLTIIPGLLLAVLLNNVKGATIVKSLIMSSMIISGAVGGIIVRFTFNRDVGIVPLLFKLIGLKNLAITWTVHPETSLLACILGSAWMWVPFTMTVYSAGLTTIPREYYEAAEIDGASSVQKFFYITLPLLKAPTIVAVFMSFLNGLKVFDIVFTATYGGPGGASNVLALQMWIYAFDLLDFNRASALALFLTVICLFIAVPLLKRSGRR